MSDAAGAALWGGRFEGQLHPVFEALNRSLPFDRRMVLEDLRGSRAWAEALRRAGVLTDDEAGEIRRGLEAVDGDVRGSEAAIDRSNAEDVHSFVEEQLIARIGDLGKKLHTGRSRNDQVATDLRLYLRHAVREVIEAARDAQAALVDLANDHATSPLPGYTHLQRAQPITFGHQCLAYVEMLGRDKERLKNAAARFEECPLGSGALSGVPYPIDRERLAEALGFERGVTRNSLDAVGSRDHVLEVVFACLGAMLSLSRFAEDWIFLASQESGVLSFGDTVSTGSSLMPQKRNPDALELLRGKTGRVHGALTTLVTMTKGLPLAYDKDLQEDKEALFDALDTTETCLRVAALVARDVTFNEERARAHCSGGFLDATDLADLLVQRGVPFREAHDRIGSVVNAAVESGTELIDIPSSVRASLLPELDGVDLDDALSVDAMLARRSSTGGTAPSRVLAEARAWRRDLADEGAGL